MKRFVIAFALALLPAIPSRIFAKAETVKIVIQGTDLEAPIQITDRRFLADIQVWSDGAGLCVPVRRLHSLSSER